jgi:hypothetical protein
MQSPLGLLSPTKCWPLCSLSVFYVGVRPTASEVPQVLPFAAASSVWCLLSACAELSYGGSAVVS